jgi:hypothetical protein
MSNFQLPKLTVLDTGGDSLPGAKLYFYTTGTTTPLAVYQDEAQTTPHTNPVVCDAAGRAGPIYLQVDQTYKIVVKTSDDVTIYTVDPVKAYTTAKGVEDTAQIDYVTPVDFGAIGDGASDETLAVQQAFDAITSNNINLLGKTYRCDSTLTLSSNKRVYNGTLDFSECTDSVGVSIAGTLGDNVYTPSVNIAKGATSVTLLTTTGLSIGDMVQLRASGEVTSETYGKHGELHIVDSIVSSTNMRINGGVSEAFSTTNGLSMRVITPVANVSLENITFVSNTTVKSVVKVQYGKDVALRNLHFGAVQISALQVQDSYNVQLDNCTSTKQLLAEATVGVFTVEGTSREVSISNCNIQDCSTGVLFYELLSDGEAVSENNYAWLQNCNVVSCEVNGFSTYGYAVACGGTNIKFTDCAAYGYDNTVSIGFYVISNDTTVRQCSTRNVLDGVRFQTLAFTNTAIAWGGAVVSCSISAGSIGANVSGPGGSSTGHPAYNGVRVEDNAFTGGVDGVVVAAAGASFAHTNFFITGNTFNTHSGYGVHFNPNTEATVSYSSILIANNTFKSCATGMRLRNCNKVAIDSNAMTTCTSEGVLLGNVSTSTPIQHIAVTNLFVDGCTHAVSLQGLFANVQIANVLFASATQHAVTVVTNGATASRRLRVSGVSGVLASSKRGVSVVTDTAGTIADVGVSNCTLSGGSEHVWVEKCTNAAIGNCVSNASTGSAVYVYNSGYVTVANCSGRDCNTVVECAGTDRFSITGIVADNSTTYGVRIVSNCDSGVVSGVQGYSIGESLVLVSASAFIQVGNLSAHECAYGVIVGSASTHVNISSSVFTSTTNIAVLIQESSDNTYVDGCYINSAATGVQVSAGSSAVGVRNSYFKGCTSYGMYCAENVNTFVFQGNTIDNALSSSEIGVYIRGGLNITVSGNAFGGGDRGVILRAGLANITHTSVDGNSFKFTLIPVTLDVESGASNQLNNVTVSNNACIATSQIVLCASGAINDLVVSNNQFHADSTANSAVLAESNNVTITRIRIANNTCVGIAYVFYLNNGGNTTLSGTATHNFSSGSSTAMFKVGNSSGISRSLIVAFNYGDGKTGMRESLDNITVRTLVVDGANANSNYPDSAFEP